VLDFVKKHINLEVIITGDAQNIQKWQYPMEAIREIVLNMVIHRDYCAAADSVVKVFDNKIEFFNPGTLPEGLTIEMLLANDYKSTPRNKVVAEFFKNIGLIEKYGSGIGRIISYFREESLPLPEFRLQSGGFLVTVFTPERLPERLPEKLGKTSQKIVDEIANNSAVTLGELSEKLKISRVAVKKHISKLKSLGRLERVGPDKGGYWKVNNGE
jgi:ATP-dependent DNA helicase RecG